MFKNHTFKLHFVPLTHAGSVKRLFWSLIFVAATCGMLYNIAQVTMIYLSFPVDVTISVVQAQSLTFPVVSICNLSPIKKSHWINYMVIQSLSHTSKNIHPPIHPHPQTLTHAHTHTS